MPNQTMVYSCSGAEQEYTMVWFGIFLYLLVSSLKIRFCEQSVFAKSPLLVDGSGQNHEEKIEAHFSPGDLEGKSLRNPKHLTEPTQEI